MTAGSQCARTGIGHTLVCDMARGPHEPAQKGALFLLRQNLVKHVVHKGLTYDRRCLEDHLLGRRVRGMRPRTMRFLEKGTRRNWKGMDVKIGVAAKRGAGVEVRVGVGVGR